MKKINIGLCGAGTVGGGALEILEAKREDFLAQGLDFQVKMICARNLDSLQNYAEEGVKLTTDWQDVVDHEEIDLIVEVIGGTTVAWEIVQAALKNNKHVVTANKALVAEHFEALYDLLSEKPECKFGFEASVGGGIPIISTLQTQFQSDEITQLAGILNGTTNFILSKMESEGADYQEVLKEAQDLGFAEADPTADVEGHDARAKISILTQLVTGTKVAESDIFTQGISRIGKIDFEYAHFLNSTIKLLSITQVAGQKISSFVTPTLVPSAHAIGQVHGATNILAVGSKFQENTYLIGQGAGKFPTGNSVVTDIVRIVENQGMPHFPVLTDFEFEPNFSASFYVRFWVKDQLGLVQKIGELCAQNNISIDSVVQLPILDQLNLPFVITTGEATLENIQAFCDQIQKEEFCNEEPFFLPVLG